MDEAETENIAMHYSVRLFFTLLMLCNLIVWPGISIAQDSVQFSWAVLIDTPDGPRVLDLSRPQSLSCGTTLQVHIEQKPGAYIYIYLEDSIGDINFLFPQQPDYYNLTLPTEKIFRIPTESRRIELVPPGGQEKLHLIAAASRLENLEKLTAEYLEQPDDSERKAAIIQELKIIRRQHSSLAKVTESSVPVAGTIRSRGEQNDTFEITKVDAINFYSKILRISHE